MTSPWSFFSIEFWRRAGAGCVAVVVAGGLVASCSSPSAPSGVVPVTMIGETADSESDVGVQATFVIRDQETFRQVWTRLYRGRRDVPVVDFSQHMVIVVALGPQPTTGYGVKITGMMRRDRVLVVAVTTVAPGASCVTAPVITFPVAVSRAPRFDGPVRFEFTRTTRECTGR